MRTSLNCLPSSCRPKSISSRTGLQSRARARAIIGQARHRARRPSASVRTTTSSPSYLVMMTDETYRSPSMRLPAVAAQMCSLSRQLDAVKIATVDTSPRRPSTRRPERAVWTLTHALPRDHRRQDHHRPYHPRHPSRILSAVRTSPQAQCRCPRCRRATQTDQSLSWDRRGSTSYRTQTMVRHRSTARGSLPTSTLVKGKQRKQKRGNELCVSLYMSVYVCHVCHVYIYINI